MENNVQPIKNNIKSIRKITKLYKQPLRIGETMKFEGQTWLIISIQEVKIVYSKLEVLYICQNLEVESTYEPIQPLPTNYERFHIEVRTGKEEVLEKISLGRMFWHNDKPYQSVEYTDVKIEYTEVVVSFLAKPIFLVSPSEAKSKLLQERMKTTNLKIL